MNKTYRGIAALALAAASSQAFALGLGAIVVKSQLDEPLVAEIPVIGASPDEASGLQARLAAPNEMERAGVDASRASAPVELQVAETRDGRTVIRVTTRSAVHDPMMAFLVNVSWPSGRLMREYKVTFAGNSSGSASTVTQAAPEPERAAPAVAPAPPPKPKAAPAEPKPAVAARPTEPAPKPVAAEPKPQPAKATPPPPAPAPAKPVAAESKAPPPATTQPKAAESKAPPPATTQPKPVAAEAKPASAKPVAAEVKAAPVAPPPPAPPAKPAVEAKASAPPPKVEAAPPAAKPVAAPPASTAASVPADPHAELERAKAELAAKESESNALKSRLAELEKSQPANRERLEQENRKLEDTERQLNDMARQVDAQQDAVAQTQAGGTTPPPPAPAPGAEASGANVPESASSAVPVEPRAADAGAAPSPPPGTEPSPPPTPEYRWYDDWLVPGGIGIGLLLVAALAFLRMRRGKVAAAPAFTPERAADPEFDLSEAEPAFGDEAAPDFAAVEPDPAVDSEEQFNMLRLLYLRGDATGFEQAAQQLYEQDPDPELWRRVAEMGRMVSPGNPLFADAGGIKRMEFDLPELSTPVAAEAMAESDSLHELLFEPGAATPPPPPSEPVHAESADDDYEAILLEEAEAALPPAEPEADEPSTIDMSSPASGTDDAGSPASASVEAYDWPEEGAGSTESAPVAAAPAPPPPAPESASRSKSGGEDAVDTKLELALAYLEMGDPEAARQMLDEVMDEGDSRQKAEALKLRAEAGGGQRGA